MQEILEKRRQPEEKSGRGWMKSGEEYGVCGWGANRIARPQESIGRVGEKMVRDEQIL
jgi:hypothetical protein